MIRRAEESGWLMIEQKLEPDPLEMVAAMLSDGRLPPPLYGGGGGGGGSAGGGAVSGTTRDDDLAAAATDGGGAPLDSAAPHEAR